MGRGSNNNLLYGVVPVGEGNDMPNFNIEMFSPILKPLLNFTDSEPDYRSVYGNGIKRKPLLINYAPLVIADRTPKNEPLNRYSGSLDLLFKGFQGGAGVPAFTKPRDPSYLPEMMSLNEINKLENRVSALDNNHRENRSRISIRLSAKDLRETQLVNFFPTQEDRLDPSKHSPGDSYRIPLARMMAVEKHYGSNGRWTFDALERGLFYSVKAESSPDNENENFLAWASATKQRH